MADKEKIVTILGGVRHIGGVGECKPDSEKPRVLC